MSSSKQGRTRVVPLPFYSWVVDCGSAVSSGGIFTANYLVADFVISSSRLRLSEQHLVIDIRATGSRSS